MGNETKRGRWYEAGTGNHQGLIIDEKTGRNIAVAYDKADAPLIAAAPEMMEALKECRDALRDIINAARNGQPYTPKELAAEFMEPANLAEAALQNVEAA